jgi:anti-sigma factor RsiW
MSRFDDGILVAYVDGELDEAVAREVEAAIASDPELRRKTELLRLSGSIAREAFRDSRHKTSPLHVTQQRSGARGLLAARLRRIGLPVAASMLAALIGFQVGVWRGKPAEVDFAENLIEEVAGYHAIYARENEHLVEVKADRVDEIESWLGERLQRKLRVPDLTDRGLAFRGARLLVVDKHPVAELLYSSPENPDQPLALCITIGPSEALPYRTQQQGDMTLALWGDHGFVYILAGWLDGPTLAALAAELKPMLDEI